METVSNPTGVNGAAQFGDTVVSGVVGIGVSAGEALLFADYPFLLDPGLKQLVELAFNLASGYVVRGLSQVVTFDVIDVQVAVEDNAFNKALAALKAAQATKDVNAIAQALAAFQVAAQNMGHSDGSATPS